MEEVLKQFSGAGLGEEESTSSFETLYKNRWRLGTQEERRLQMLQIQKKYVNIISYSTITFISCS